LANLTRQGPFSDLDDPFRGFMMRPVHRGTGTEAAAQIKIEIK